MMAENEIKIGITGDYPPLTLHIETTDTYQGFDIDMAYNLGKFLNKTVTFVKTTWPTLEQDLQANKFSIAMGGIGVTSARAQKFLFTKPVLTDEKVAVFNKVDSLKFKKFSDINNAQVRVIENPGGTNEFFVRQHLPDANIIIFSDNKTIFSQLLMRQADVMITDSIEAQYQRKLHPELGILQFPEETHYEYKAYMLRKQDMDLLNSVNDWIEAITENKLLNTIKDTWFLI